jgi:hypothetical protein
MNDPEKYLIIAIPSRSGMSLSLTMVHLFRVAALLNRAIYWYFPHQNGLSLAKTGVIRDLNENMLPRRDADFPDGYHYVFWIDSDILLTGTPGQMAELAGSIAEAERKNVSFMGNYHIEAGGIGVWINSCYKKSAPGSELPLTSYSTEELENAAPFTLRCDGGTLGLCYMKMPCNYVLHDEGYNQEKGTVMEEDMNFFIECPQRIYYVPIPNLHQKLVLI